MTIIVKEGMTDWNHAIDKGNEKRFSEEKTQLDRLIGAMGEKILPKDTTNRTSVGLAKMSSSARLSAWRLEMTIFNTFCRTPVVVPLCFETK